MTDQEFQKLQNQLQQRLDILHSKKEKWDEELKNKLNTYFPNLPNFTIKHSDNSFSIYDNKNNQLVKGVYCRESFFKSEPEVVFTLCSIELIDDENTNIEDIKRVINTFLDKDFRKDITDTFIHYNNEYWDFSKNTIYPLSNEIELEKIERKEAQFNNINSTIKVGDTYKILKFNKKEINHYIKIEKVTPSYIYIKTTYEHYTLNGDELRWDEKVKRQDRATLVDYIMGGYAFGCDDPVKE